MIKRKNINLFILGTYFLFFLILFAQFPLKKAIPGNCDSWLVIALSNSYLNEIISSMTNVPIGTSMYPAENIFSYGESSPGGAFLFLLFRIFGLNNINSYYLYITSIFALTAFGIFLLSRFYTRSILPSLLAGFMFTCSNFILANIDDSIIVFYFLPAMTILFLKKYLKYYRIKYLYFSAIFGGLQIYFSSYVFIYQTIVLTVFVLLYPRKFLGHNKVAPFLKYIAIYALLSIPYMISYLSIYSNANFFNPFGPPEHIGASCSLTPINFFRVLPNNLIYDFNIYFIERSNTTNSFSSLLAHQGLYWGFLRKSAFIGFLVLFLAGLSFKKINKHKLELIIIGLLGVILSTTQSINLCGVEIYPPLKVLSSIFPILKYLRVPLRAYALFIFAISILAAFGMKAIIPKIKFKGFKSLILLIVCFIFFLENIPMPLQAYNIENYDRIPAEYANFFKNTENKIILDLPSRGINNFDISQRDLFHYNREIIYMNWQNQHKQNIFNGVNGYFPKKRSEIQKIVNQLPNTTALASLKNMGLDYIVFHKDMVLSPDEDILESLKKIKQSDQVLDTERLTIFRLIKN